MNKAYTELTNKYGIIWKFATLYHPETNGTVERCNVIFLSKLRKMTSFGEIQWNIFLNNAVKATNISFSRAIDMSLFYTTFVIFPKLKLDENFILDNKKHHVI